MSPQELQVLKKTVKGAGSVAATADDLIDASFIVASTDSPEEKDLLRELVAQLAEQSAAIAALWAPVVTNAKTEQHHSSPATDPRKR